MLNFHAGYRCTLVPRLPFPVPRFPFPVTSFSNIRLIKAPAKRSQHCWAQHVACVWPPCCDVLRHVGCCCLKFENGQIWANNTHHVATCRNTVAKCTQHASLNNVAICCVDMLRSIGRGLIQGLLRNLLCRGSCTCRLFHFASVLARAELWTFIWPLFSWYLIPNESRCSSIETCNSLVINNVLNVYTSHCQTQLILDVCSDVHRYTWLSV